MGDDEDLTYFIARTVTGSLSFIGCVFIIITILCFKDLWTFYFRIIMFLAISNSITAVGFLMPIDDGLYCKIGGFLNNFGSVSSLFLTCFIMRSLYRLIIYEEQVSKKLEYISISISYTLPLIGSIIGIQYYGKSDGWCWFKSNKENLPLILIEFYIPYFIILSLNIFFCYKIRKFLINCKDEPSVKNLKVIAFKRFIFYPIILLVCYIPVIVHRYYKIVNDDNPPMTVNILATIANGIYGFCCTIVYGFTKYVRSKMFRRTRITDPKEISMIKGEDLF